MCVLTYIFTCTVLWSFTKELEVRIIKVACLPVDFSVRPSDVPYVDSLYVCCIFLSFLVSVLLTQWFRMHRCTVRMVWSAVDVRAVRLSTTSVLTLQWKLSTKTVFNQQDL